MTFGIDDHSDASRHYSPADPPDICVLVNVCLADADSIGIASGTFIRDIDVVTSSREVDPGSVPQCDVVAAACDVTR